MENEFLVVTEHKQIKIIQNKLDKIWNEMGNSPEEAFKQSKNVEKESIQFNYSKGIKEARFYQGWCLIYMSRLKEAVDILSDLSWHYKEDDAYEENVKVLNALGVAYNDLGDNTNAFYYYSRSLKLSRKAKLLDRELSVLNNMGRYFLDNNNFDKALGHYKQILEKIDNSVQTLELKSVVLMNTGICYCKIKNYGEAEKYLLQSLALTKTISNKVIEVDAYFELATVQFATGNNHSAKDYIDKGLKLCNVITNKNSECELLLMLGEIDDDLKIYQKALKLSNIINYKSAYSRCSLKISEYYEKRNEYKKSLLSLKEHYKSENELNHLATEKKFHNLEMEYEIERNRKNAEIFKIQNLELQESLNWMTILNRIARETMSSLELDSIFETVYKNINILMRAEIFHIAIHDEDRRVLNFLKVIENENEIVPFTISDDISKSFAAWSIFNKKEILINNLENEYKEYIEERMFYGAGLHAKSLINVPIYMRDNKVGVLSIQSYNQGAYKEEHVQLLKSLAAYLSIAIDNSQNFEKVTELNKMIFAEKKDLEIANSTIMELATHDNLTGLANRRLFHELLESAMLQASRRGETIAILFIDLDNFKPVNDTWGHYAGDKVLKEIAMRLKSKLRSSDSVARIGGDEFLILLNPVHNRDEAKNVAEKLIKEVGKPIKIGEITAQIGMSVGISIYPDQNTSAEQLIILADSAMYNVKKGGKNGIAFY